MHSVTGTISNHVGQNSPPNQRQISNQIQDLVPNELVWITQGRIYQTVAGKDDRVLLRGTADQALLTHELGLVKEAEGAGGGDFREIVAVGQIQCPALAADQSMGKVDGIGHPI